MHIPSAPAGGAELLCGCCSGSRAPQPWGGQRQGLTEPLAPPGHAGATQASSTFLLSFPGSGSSCRLPGASPGLEEDVTDAFLGSKLTPSCPLGRSGNSSSSATAPADGEGHLQSCAATAFWGLLFPPLGRCCSSWGLDKPIQKNKAAEHEETNTGRDPCVILPACRALQSSSFLGSRGRWRSWQRQELLPLAGGWSCRTCTSSARH